MRIYTLAWNIVRERQCQLALNKKALFMVHVLSVMNAVHIAQKDTDPALVI